MPFRPMAADGGHANPETTRSDKWFCPPSLRTTPYKNAALQQPTLSNHGYGPTLTDINGQARGAQSGRAQPRLGTCWRHSIADIEAEARMDFDKNQCHG
jgi:hypothetical protein